jgi:hypothetical protein
MFFPFQISIAEAISASVDGSEVRSSLAETETSSSMWPCGVSKLGHPIRQSPNVRPTELIGIFLLHLLLAKLPVPSNEINKKTYNNLYLT